MCGRVGLVDDAQFIKEATKILKNIESKLTLQPSYNIAPSQPLATLTNDHTCHYTEFGLLPHWAKDKKFRPINARAESLHTKPTFRTPFKTNRSIIPINGFYEWRKEGNHKVPYWIYPKENNYFALAGITDTFMNKETGENIVSSAIITTSPNELMLPIHDRMPVILEPQDWELWLAPNVQEYEVIQPLLKPFDPNKMDAYEVSTFVNSPANNSKQCIEPRSNSLF